MIEINLGVHELVDFILRSGDIDDRYFNNETMKNGSLIHAKYQYSQNSKYESEVFLKGKFIYKEYVFILTGRCDGIIHNKIPTIDEIKTTNSNSLEDFYIKNEKWHLGQAEIYALIYLLNNNLDKINVRLTYLSQIKKKDKLIKKYFYLKDDLIKNVESYFEKYIFFLNEDEKYKRELKISLDNLKFPYDNPRSGQLEISNIVIDSIEKSETVFIEAATGIGKTISVLYGSLFGLKNDSINRVFYLTAKNSGFLPILNQLGIYQNQKLFIRSCVIYSKEKSCINKNKNKKCNPEDCIYARNYYSKLNSIILDCIQNDMIFDEKVILKYALKYEVCPFELSLDLSKISTIIICDYNYVFHPISYLKTYFNDYNENKFKICYLIDEAHNLINRARNMYSTSLSLENINKSLEELNTVKNFKKLKNKIKILRNYIKNSFDNQSLIVKEINDLNYEIVECLTKINDFSKDFKKNNCLSKSLETENLLLSIYQFLTIYKLFDNNFKIYYEKNYDGIALNIYCVDPSMFVNKVLYSNSSILFSGTLTPIDYYKKITLGSNNYNDFSFESPYNHENLKILIDSNISLYYKDRKNTIDKVAKEILTFISYKVGNYLIYLPSFKYLEELKEFFKDLNYNLFFQNDKSINKRNESDLFLNFFQRNNQMNVAFCILGGSYSEGIDIKNNLLNGICIVGVGLPSIDTKNQFLKDYYDENNINGFNFAYTNPGINKVLQAIGRLIRNEKDKGVVLLIDKRYSYKEYKDILNTKYKNITQVNENNLNSYLKEFYKI